jgi:hypothetical protein
MTGSVRPRVLSVLACGVGALALTAGLSACGSSTTTGSAGGSQPVTAGGPSSPAPAGSGQSTGAGSAAPSASTTATSPAMGSAGGAVSTPQQVLTAVPAGVRLTPFTGASTSGDGRTVYVHLESMGGACGQYDVVLQQSSTSVGVGLVHLPSGHRICPQFIGPLRVAVALSAPLGGRPLVDLATGQRLNVG